MVTVSKVKCTVSEAKYIVNMLSVLNNFIKKKIFNSLKGNFFNFLIDFQSFQSQIKMVFYKNVVSLDIFYVQRESNVFLVKCQIVFRNNHDLSR